jgi:2'-5' RNA ligase
MKNLGFRADTDAKIFEYLLLIPPSDFVSKKISEIKLTFSDVHGCENAAKLTPHLTMIKFLQRETMEFRIINCFEKFTHHIAPFAVELDGFGEFPPHTIYVKPSTAKPIADLVIGMRAMFGRMLKFSDLLKPTFVTNPHLTIARGMSEEQYQAIWPIYKKQEFLGSFMADQMVLIKREVDPFTLKKNGKYRPVRHFPFLGKVREQQLLLAL